MSRSIGAVLCVLVCCTAGVAQKTASRSTAPLPEDVLMLLQQGTLAMRSNQPEEAVRDFQQVTAKAPHFAEGYLNLGLALSQLSRNGEAAAALGQAVALKPALRGAHLFLAIADYKLDRQDAAAAAIRKETALDPKAAQAWMWQGIIDLAQAQLTSAVEDLDRASSLDPKNVDILYHRGRAALALSRESYETLYKEDPQSWHVHQILAQADVESDHDVDAVEQYKQAIATAPVQGGLYEAMGSSLWRTGKYQEAEQAFETALKLDPNDSLTLYKLGCLRIDRGNAAAGKPLLERAIAADPSLKLSSYYLGRAESELGNDQKAVADFKKVIADDIDPDTTKQAYFQLSRSYRRLHDNTAATAAQAEYRRLDEQGKDVMQEKLRRHNVRADRDVSIPAPTVVETP